MGLFIFCCPQALVTNITELTITSYAWMRTSDEQIVDAEQCKKRSRHPNIERLMKKEWDFRHIKENIVSTGEEGYCIVCFDSFEHVKESKLIPCGHKEICPKCAIRLISMRGKNTTCPQCRHVVWKYVVMEDNTRTKITKNTTETKNNNKTNDTLIVEDFEDKKTTPDKLNVITSTTEKDQKQKVDNHQHKSRSQQQRHCNVCFRPFFNQRDSNNTDSNTGSFSVLERGIRVRESRLLPCGHEDVCVTCAGLITSREVDRECPQCRRFVRRYITIEQQTERGGP